MVQPHIEARPEPSRYLHSWIVTHGQTSLPFPSPGDAGWLAFYPFAYLAISSLIRSQLRESRARTMLDGLIVGLAAAAALSALAMGFLIKSGPGTLFTEMVGVAYPIGDALLVGMLLCLLAVRGRAWHADLSVLAVAILAFAVADTGYLALASHGAYTPGDLADIGYVVALAVIGFSPWQRKRPMVVDDGGPGRLQILPTIFALCALGIVLVGSFTHLPAISITLGGLALIAVVGRALVSFRQIRALTERRRVEARRDELTGLENRRAFHEHLAGRFATDTGSDVAVLLLDLDRFKEVNDSFGHHTGDRLLQQVGERLRSCVRHQDGLFRMGGDEFVVVASGPKAKEGYAADLAARLRGELQKPFDIDGIPVTIGVSIGIALRLDPAEGTDALLQHADIAMYKAKASREGPNFYRRNGDVESRQRLEMINALQRDAGTDAMVLHFQPKLDLRTHEVVGVEALVRWQHPMLGLVYPDVFLPLAEQIGLMATLTRNVLEQAIRQCATWRAGGRQLTVSVNVSASDLGAPDFSKEVAALLLRHGLPPEALLLEITETVAMADNDGAWLALEKLSMMGIGISIDDFGTDYSTLAYLQRLFSAHELKLDRSFITRVLSQPRSVAIVKSSIDLAHALGMVVVAEGVETAEVLDQLTRWGCDLAQGYHVGRPRPADSCIPRAGLQLASTDDA